MNSGGTLNGGTSSSNCNADSYGDATTISSDSAMATSFNSSINLGHSQDFIRKPLLSTTNSNEWNYFYISALILLWTKVFLEKNDEYQDRAEEEIQRQCHENGKQLDNELCMQLLKQSVDCPTPLAIWTLFLRVVDWLSCSKEMVDLAVEYIDKFDPDDLQKDQEIVKHISREVSRKLKINYYKKQRGIGSSDSSSPTQSKRSLKSTNQRVSEQHQPAEAEENTNRAASPSPESCPEQDPPTSMRVQTTPSKSLSQGLVDETGQRDTGICSVKRFRITLCPFSISRSNIPHSDEGCDGSRLLDASEVNTALYLKEHCVNFPVKILQSPSLTKKFEFDELNFDKDSKCLKHLVFKATKTCNKDKVALKFYLCRSRDKWDSTCKFYVNISTREGHAESICKMDCGDPVKEYPGYYFIGFEQGVMTLTDWISNKPDSMDRYCILYKIGQCVRFLHRENYVHRDLKPDNIMKFVYREGREQWKLVDMDSAVCITDPTEKFRAVCTIHYASRRLIKELLHTKQNQPELLLEPKKSDDIYALGIIAFEIFTGKRLYEGKTEEDILSLYQNDEAATRYLESRLELIEEKKDKSMVKQCLQLDEKRKEMTIERFLGRPIFKRQVEETLTREKGERERQNHLDYWRNLVTGVGRVCDSVLPQRM